MSGLTITLLGEARAEVDGVKIQVDTRKAIALLAWLAMTGREQRRETLAALLWPDSDDARARAALRRTLSTLSGALAGRWLAATRERVRLSDDGVNLDVTRFQRLLATAGSGERAALTEAVALYHGDFMAGFSLRDSPDFDDWQREQSDRLRSALGTALERLVTAAGTAGAWDEAIGFARRRLALDPLREETQRQLMQLYAWAGDRSAALRQYRDCVRVLEQELGVAPLEETTALYQAIQEQRLAPLPVSVAAPVSDGAVLSPAASVSTDDYPLVGRSRELAQIQEAWDAVRQDGRLVTIEGEAGVGKTRLVEGVMAEAERRGRRALCLRCYEGEAQLAFGPIIDGLNAALSKPELARALAQLPREATAELARLFPRMAAQAGSAPTPLNSPGAQARFFDAIVAGLQAAVDGAGPGVLIIDDAHWIDDASLSLVGYLIRRLAGRALLLVVTWRSEQVIGDHRLRQLATGAVRAGTGRMLALGRLSSNDVQVLAHQTALDLGVEPDALGTRLFLESEGLPFFAVEYLNQLRLHALPASDNDWPLPAGPRALLQRRIASLSATEAQILTALAAIGRACRFELLRDASGRSEDETVSALDGLLAQGIVAERESEGGPVDPVYAIRHDKLREVVYDEMSLTRRRLLHRRIADTLRSQSGAGATAAQVAFHLTLSGQDRGAADAYLAAGESAAALYATSEALGHFEAALAHGHPDVATLHERIGDLRTLRGDYQAALGAYETAAALRPPPDSARIEHKLGNIQQRMGAWERAVHHYAAAEPLYRAEATPAGARWLARLTSDWSLTALRMGDLAQATRLGRDTRRLAETVGDEHALAQSDNLLGILARTGGDYLAARRHFEAALAEAIRLGEPDIRAAALNNLARVVQMDGDSDRALSLAREALALSVAHGDRHREAALHSNLADLLHAAGQPEAAREHLRASATIYAEIGVVAGEFQPEIWKLSEW